MVVVLLNPFFADALPSRLIIDAEFDTYIALQTDFRHAAPSQCEEFPSVLMTCILSENDSHATSSRSVSLRQYQQLVLNRLPTWSRRFDVEESN